MVAPSPFLTEAPNGQVVSSPFAESGHSAGMWMGRNKCFVLETFAAVDEGAGSDRIEDMKRRWSKAVDVFLFLLHYQKETPSSDNDGGDRSDDEDAVSQFKATWYDKLKDLHTDPQTRHYHTMVHLAEMFGFLDILLPNSPLGPADGLLSAEVLARQSAAPIRAMLEAVSTMATFFHDAVYDATSSTNEEDSAELFRNFAGELKALVEDGSGDSTPRRCSLFDCATEWVCTYILSTKSHSATINGENADGVGGVGASKGMLNHITRYFSRHMLAFLDADMAVLAKESASYDAYAGLIRKEYIHVPRDVYCEKRAEVLESFLVDPMTGKTKFVFATNVMRTSYELKAKDNLQKEIASLKSGVIPCEDFVEDGEEIENKTGSDGVLEEEVNENGSGIIEDSEENDVRAGGSDEIKKQKDTSDVVDDDLAPGWEAVHDPNSGREYYYNSQTGETVWDKPITSQQELQVLGIDHSSPLAVDDAIEVEGPSEDAVAIDSITSAVPVADTTAGSDSPTKQSDMVGDEVVEEAMQEDVIKGDMLPYGWNEMTDDSGNLYYYNAESGETSWTRPTSDFSNDEAAAKKSDGSNNEHSMKEEESADEMGTKETPLPSGWTSLIDESSGRIYFYNEGTGETSWDRPVDNVSDESNVDDLTKDAPLANTDMPSESDPGIAAADLFAQAPIAGDVDAQASESAPGIAAADLFAQPPIADDSLVSGADAFVEPSIDVDAPASTEPDKSPPDTADDAIADTRSPDADDGIVEAISNDAAGEDTGNPFMEKTLSDPFASSAFDRPPPTENNADESNAANVFAAPSTADVVFSAEPATLSSDTGLVNDGSVEAEKETHGDTSSDLPPLSAGWTELVDDSSGQVYYYNEESGITSWDRPIAPSSGPPDTAGESSSTNDGLPINDGVESESELEDIPTTNDGEYSLVNEKEETAESASPEAMGGFVAQEQPLPEGWEQLVDPTSGKPYYYCKIDDTTSWERPSV